MANPSGEMAGREKNLRKLRHYSENSNKHLMPQQKPLRDRIFTKEEPQKSHDVVALDHWCLKYLPAERHQTHQGAKENDRLFKCAELGWMAVFNKV